MQETNNKVILTGSSDLRIMIGDKRQDIKKRVKNFISFDLILILITLSIMCLMVNPMRFD